MARLKLKPAIALLLPFLGATLWLAFGQPNNFRMDSSASPKSTTAHIHADTIGIAHNIQQDAAATPKKPTEHGAANNSKHSSNPLAVVHNEKHALSNQATPDTPRSSAVLMPQLIGSVEKNGRADIPALLLERSNRFTFPAISNSDNGQQTKMTIPAGDLPARPARRFIKRGNGKLVGYGDEVALHVEIYNWSAGKLVSTSANQGGPLVYTIGDDPSLPPYVEQSLIGREIGSQMQIVLNADNENLPGGVLDPQDAYVYLVKIDQP